MFWWGLVGLVGLVDLVGLVGLVTFLMFFRPGGLLFREGRSQNCPKSCLEGAWGAAWKAYVDQVALQRGAGGAQGPNSGAKLAPRGPLEEAKGGNLAKTSRKLRFWKAHWMGQWAPLEQGWGSSVRKPTEMRPRRGQNEHPWPPKTLTIAGEVLRKSMLEALRQKLWPRLPPKAAQEEPRGPTLQKHTVFTCF